MSSQAQIQVIPDDLERITQLARRAVVDCERDQKTRAWSPEARALVDVVTQRFTRGPRLSCACADRRVVLIGRGVVRIFREGHPDEVPPLPLDLSVDDFCADNAHDTEAVRAVRDLRPGLVSTSEVRLPGLGHSCITKFNPVQAWALRELREVRGILGSISIGGGKTLIGIMAPLAVPCRLAVLLAKPDQRLHYRLAYLRLREHFHVPSIVFDKVEMPNDDRPLRGIVPGAPVLRFVPYSLLSRPESTDYLIRLKPDMIIADEAHCLSAAPSAKRQGSARTGRFLDFIKSRDDVIFCAWSGSLINKSLLDVTHLAAYALGLGSPYPIVSDEAVAWSGVLDPSREPDRDSDTAEALRATFGGRRHVYNAPSLESFADVRSNLQRRVIETPGVISTRSSSVGCSINIYERKVSNIPQSVLDALDKVRDWKRPDDEELVEETDRARCSREVGAGFFYRFEYPRGEPLELRERWFAARKFWNKETREKLFAPVVHMDSPLLCWNAAARYYRGRDGASGTCTKCESAGTVLHTICRGSGTLSGGDCTCDAGKIACSKCGGDGDIGIYRGPLPTWNAASWPEWSAICDLVEPASKPVWIDDYLAQDAARWAKEHLGIVWCATTAFGRRVAEILGVPYHSGGPNAEAAILAEKGNRSIIASIRAHGEGRDGLQHKFREQLVAEIPASGKTWEQLLGRLAREGQRADEIDTWIFLHIEENKDALRKAISYAEFDQEMSANQQLLLAADVDFDL